jgi:hypothetical protein
MEKNNRSYQQNLVMNQLTEGLKSVELANDNLESKATKLISGSAAAFAAITSVKLIPQASGQLTCIDALILLLLCGSVLWMFAFAIRLWGPQPLAIPTTSDTKRLNEEYLSQSEEVAYRNVLIDLAAAFEHSVAVNKVKGRELRHMFILLQLQVLLLGLSVLAKVLV